MGRKGWDKLGWLGKGWSGKGWSPAGGWSLVKNALLYDDYRTADPAPIADPLTPDPGPGLSTVVDTEDKFSISGDDLICAGGKTVGDYEDPAIWLGRDNAGTPAAIAVGAGYGQFLHYTLGTAGYWEFGHDLATNGTDAPYWYMEPSNNLYVTPAGMEIVHVGTVANGATLKLLTVQRSSTNGYHWIRDGKLLWVDESDVRDPIFTSIHNYSAVYSAHALALVDLTRYGFTNDWLDVTDTTTATNERFTHDDDFHAEISTDSAVDWYFRQPSAASGDSNNSIFIRRTGGGYLYISKFVGGDETVLHNESGVFTATHSVDVVCDSNILSVFVDGVLLADSDDVSGTSGTHGYQSTAGSTLTTHPNPALGIATDRVIAPQSGEEFSHASDFMAVIKNVVLPSSDHVEFRFRITGSDENTLKLHSNGAVQLLSNPTLKIDAGAASVSDHDDVVVIFEGVNANILVAGTSVGTTSTLIVFGGESGKRNDATDGFCDSIDLFPLYPILPVALK